MNIAVAHASRVAVSRLRLSGCRPSSPSHLLCNDSERASERVNQDGNSGWYGLSHSLIGAPFCPPFYFLFALMSFHLPPQLAANFTRPTGKAPIRLCQPASLRAGLPCGKNLLVALSFPAGNTSNFQTDRESSLNDVALIQVPISLSEGKNFRDNI